MAVLSHMYSCRTNWRLLEFLKIRNSYHFYTKFKDNYYAYNPYMYFSF